MVALLEEFFTWLPLPAAWAALAKFGGFPPGPPAGDWVPGPPAEPAADTLAEFSSCIASTSLCGRGEPDLILANEGNLGAPGESY